MSNVTKQLLEDVVRDSITLSEVARKLGKQPKGGNISALSNKCKEFEIDTRHLKGQSWAKGISKLSPEHLDDNVFVYGGTGSHKRVLIRERGHVCECCRGEKWLGERITLELDHIDGDRQNNVRENLQLLCPNCHSYTPTWRGRNVKKGLRVDDKVLKQALVDTKNIRQALETVGMTPKGSNYKRADQLLKRIYDDEQRLVDESLDTADVEVDLSPFTREVLEKLLWIHPTTTIAKLYNMSDNGVAWWARKWKLPKPPRGYWQKQTSHGKIGRTQ